MPNFFPVASNYAKLLVEIGQELPRLAPWGLALGAVGTWIVWPGLTPNFRQENLGDVDPLKLETEERNEWISKNTKFNNKCM
jgi:hypothetical protein